MIASRTFAHLASLACVVTSTVLAASYALAQPLPMRPKVTVTVSPFDAKTCGQPFEVSGGVKSEMAKLDGRFELRGVSTPVTVAKDGEALFTANGGTYDCSKNLGATLTVQNGADALGKGLPLFSKQFDPKSINFIGSNNIKQTIAPYGGFVAITVTGTCGAAIKATIYNKLEGKAGGAGPDVKLIVAGNGVTRVGGAFGSTDVELGILDCTKGAPSFTFGGSGLASSTIVAGKVLF